MTLSTELTHGLQEWAIACRALGEGRITMLVRKGGIHERGGGLFQLEQQRFALMPTYLHQDARRLTATYQDRYFAEVATDPQPGHIRIQHWAEAVHIWKVTEVMAVLNLGAELLWNANEINLRFAYRQQPWLYVVALRVFALPQPCVIPDHPSYAGCRSWIPLRTPLITQASVPVLDDITHAARIAAIADSLGTTPH